MLRIRLLGGLSVQSPAGPVGGAAAQPRRLALLAVIARSGRRGVTRDELLALLWPDLDDERGRAVLRNALYALRRDLGEAAISGSQELRLDTDLVSCDLLDFEAALARGDLERAAQLYEGPFLHGFRLPGASELDRWADTERTRLAHRYADLLERLGREAAGRGDVEAGVRWWRLAAAHDPLNARYAVELMNALVAAGNRSGALQHARIYEALVEEELNLPPDREVVALAERIRAEAGESAAAVDAASPDAGGRPAGAEVEPDDAADGIAAPVPLPSSPAPRKEPGLRILRPASLAAVAAVAAGILWIGLGSDAATRAETVVVVGTIVDQRPGAGAGGLGMAADLLATNLARSGMRVISNARTYELLAQMGADVDRPSPAAVTAAARHTDATELIDGSLNVLPDGRLRLDVRRTDIETGELLPAHTFTGTDIFALVDSATLQLARRTGGSLPATSVAEVTTSSEVAYRFYEEGLRQFARGDAPSALPLFQAALREDSMFAMAAYYAALATPTFAPARVAERFGRALALAEGASERERLIVRAAWAARYNDPSLRAIADTLASRYPDVLEGHLHLGRALLEDGAAERGRSALRRVIAMDSLALRAQHAHCAACSALNLLVQSYHASDSLDAAVREARAWTGAQPASPLAWQRLATSLLALERRDEAVDAYGRAAQGDPFASPPFAAEILIRQDRADSAAAVLRRIAESGPPGDRFRALWHLSLALRERGRLQDALTAMHAARAVRRATADAFSIEPLAHAQLMIEAGELRDALALLDTLAHRPAAEPAATQARNRAWVLTHTATALHALRDTAGLRMLADTIAALGDRSLLGRDRLLHHYARGLLHELTGDLAAARDELRRSLVSTTTGFTRASYQLADILLRLDEPLEAVRILQPAFRGNFTSNNLYISRTALHEALGRAWQRAGRPDSADAHLRIVADAWREADPAFVARATR